MGVREGCYNEGLVISAFAEVQKDGYSFRCSFLGWILARGGLEHCILGGPDS